MFGLTEKMRIENTFYQSKRILDGVSEDASPVLNGNQTYFNKLSPLPAIRSNHLCNNSEKDNTRKISTEVDTYFGDNHLTHMRDIPVHRLKEYQVGTKTIHPRNIFVKQLPPIGSEATMKNEIHATDKRWYRPNCPLPPTCSPVMEEDKKLPIDSEKVISTLLSTSVLSDTFIRQK